MRPNPRAVGGFEVRPERGRPLARQPGPGGKSVGRRSAGRPAFLALLQPLVSSAFNAFKAFTMNCTATAASNNPMMRDRMFRAIGLRNRLL